MQVKPGQAADALIRATELMILRVCARPGRVTFGFPKMTLKKETGVRDGNFCLPGRRQHLSHATAQPGLSPRLLSTASSNGKR